MSMTRVPSGGGGHVEQVLRIPDIARPHLLARDRREVQIALTSARAHRDMRRAVAVGRSGRGDCTTSEPSAGRRAWRLGDGDSTRLPDMAFAVRSCQRAMETTPETTDRCPLCKGEMLSVLYYGADGESVGGHRICPDCGPRSVVELGAARTSCAAASWSARPPDPSGRQRARSVRHSDVSHAAL